MMEVGINIFLQLPLEWSLHLTSDIYKSTPLKDLGSLVRNNFSNKKLYGGICFKERPLHTYTDAISK